MFVSQPRYVIHLSNDFDELSLAGSIAYTHTPHYVLLSLKQEESTFVFSHFTGEMRYTITDEWPEINSVHIPQQSQDVLQSLQSSSADLVQQLAEVSE